MEGERQTIFPPTAAPEVMEATGAPRTEATPSPPRREEMRPTVVHSTSGGHAPASTTQTPTIPMDALEMFVKSLRPDLDLSQTLARLAAELTTPKPIQPIAATTNPNTRITEPSTAEKAKANPTPSTPITHPVNTPSTLPNVPPSTSQSVSQTPHTDSPAKSPVEDTISPRTEEGAVDEQGKDEGDVETRGEGSRKRKVVEGESDGVVGAKELLTFRRRKLETEAADLPSSNPTQLTPSQSISKPLHIEIPIAENEEGGDEWFDALAGIETPVEDVRNEEVYSGATEVVSEGETDVMKEGELNKEEEVEQPIQTEVMTVGTEMVKAGEPNRKEEVEQQLQPERVEMNLPEGRIEDVIVVTDGDEEVREEQSKEVAGQGVISHGDSLARNVFGAPVRGRRLLIDEASEEEEDAVLFQPIGGQLSQRQPLREEALVDRAGQLDVPMERAASAEERERLERLKRKGKQIAKPVKKKARQASTTVVIQESRSERAVVPQEEESDEDEALRWERRTKKRQAVPGIICGGGRKRLCRISRRLSSGWIAISYRGW